MINQKEFPNIQVAQKCLSMQKAMSHVVDLITL